MSHSAFDLFTSHEHKISCSRYKFPCGITNQCITVRPALSNVLLPLLLNLNIFTSIYSASIVDFQQVNNRLVSNSNVEFVMLNFYLPFIKNALLLYCTNQRQFFIFSTKRVSLSVRSLCNYLVNLYVLFIFNRFDQFRQN